MPLRARFALALVATFAVIAAGVAVLASEPAPDAGPAAGATPRGAVRPPGMPPADFRLVDQDGRPATLGDVRGQVAIVTFLYTTCEDTCPVAAQQIRGALDDLGHDVPVLAFSVDPARDTPARARRFVAEQHMTGRMRFLLGARSDLRPVWKGFAIAPQKGALDHSAYVVVVDGQGRQRVGWPHEYLTPEGLEHDLRVLLEA